MDTEIRVRKKKIPSRMQSMGISAATVGLAFSFIAHTDIVSEAVRSAGSLCVETVIPSLFPFLVLASFVVHSGLLRTSGKFLDPITRLLFNLPGEAGLALLLGLIGGFPVGPKTTAELYKLGEISKAQAQSMMLFNIGAGPAFVIGTVGVGMLGSYKSGLLLYASMVFAFLALGLAVCMRLTGKKAGVESSLTLQGLKTSEKDGKSVGDAIHIAVESGTNSMIAICAYIVIFAAVTSVISLYISDANILGFITAFLEVTRGCGVYSEMPGTGGVTAVAAIISFAGLCIHCQVLGYVREVDLPYSKFFAARIAAACLAALFCRTFLLLFPDFLPVMSNMAEKVTTDFSASVPACISLLLMSVLMVLDQKP